MKYARDKKSGALVSIDEHVYANAKQRKEMLKREPKVKELLQYIKSLEKRLKVLEDMHNEQ